MIETSVSARLAAVFHTSFASAYVRLARRKYARVMNHLPFRAQDVHVIHGGNRWWQILCVAGQCNGDMRVGPVGRYTLQAADPGAYPDLAELPDQNSPHKEEWRLAMGADFFIYHEAFAPPGPPAEEELIAAATALAERLVDAHGASYVELDALKAKLANLRNAHQLLHDLNEVQACLWSEHYRAAVVTCCAAVESALVGRLEEQGHPIRQEEHRREMGHEYHSFPALVQEIYRGGRVSSKTRERLDLMTGLRRATEHCRPDATLQDDALYAWETTLQLLRELAK